jgi:peptidoglycan hydrolase-like protein with peptidoglycan-binding domain
MSQSVKKVQRQLITLGYYKGEPNGTLDEATRTALMEYQRVSGLTETGELSEDTLMNLDNDIAKGTKRPQVQVPSLRLVRQEPIPDYYNREFKQLPAPVGGNQDNTRIPPFAGSIPQGPRVPQYAASGMVPRDLAARGPTQWLNDSPAPAAQGGFGLGTALAVVGGALVLGWWVGSRKGKGSPIIEDDNLNGDDGDDSADADTED